MILTVGHRRDHVVNGRDAKQDGRSMPVTRRPLRSVGALLEVTVRMVRLSEGVSPELA